MVELKIELELLTLSSVFCFCFFTKSWCLVFWLISQYFCQQCKGKQLLKQLVNHESKKVIVVYSHNFIHSSLNRWAEFVDLLVAVVLDIVYRWMEFGVFNLTSFRVLIWKKACYCHLVVQVINIVAVAQKTF